MGKLLNISMKIRQVAAILIMLALSVTAYAGIDVSLSRELEQLEQMQSQVSQDDPVYRRLIRQERELKRLLRLPEGLREQSTREIFRIQDELQILEKEIRQIGTDQPKYFGRAKNRVAVFTLDDPDETGVGDAVSFLLSKALLFSAPVSSYAIVNYQGGVEEPDQDGLSYFNKVERLTEGQGYIFTIWGKISRHGQHVTIDMFGQIDNELDVFNRKLTLPEAMGGGTLIARMNANRFKIQTIDMSLEAAESLVPVAESVRTLRTQPDADASELDTLPEGKAYRIVASEGSWVQLGVEDGPVGWTSVHAFCTEECRRLLNTAVYANSFIATTKKGKSGPGKMDGITNLAVNAQQQIFAMTRFQDSKYDALEIARDKSPEAGFASIQALAEIAIELDKLKLETPFGQIRLDKSFVQDVAGRLARASLATPQDLDILDNLVVLFNYLGDNQRRKVASNIAASIRQDN
jgi:hypothetical protein